MRIELANGRLTRDGVPWTPVGVDYHPSGAGCRYWRDWDGVAIEDDMARIAERGFDAVRFFVFWRDFEPEPGRYDEVALARLRALVDAAARHGVACLPSLLTIWMNGQPFDLPWRRGRSLWRDPGMVERERAYVATVARALAGAGNVLAYDLGDELVQADAEDAATLPAADAAAWQAGLAEAIRAEHPGALVLQANELHAILARNPFTPWNARALDLVGVHGFPVWSPFAIESATGYKATSLVPFLVALTRAHALPLVDEIADYGAGAEESAAYLRAAGHSALAAGAAGVLAWCWQDIADAHPPYVLRPGERFVGLTTLDGSPKPALGELAALAERASDWSGLAPARAPIAVYLPRAPLPAADGEVAPADAVAAFYAYLLLKRAHLPFEFATGALERYELVICPAPSRLTLPDVEALERALAAGATVYCSAGDHLHGTGADGLFGVERRDFTLDGGRRAGFAWRGRDYPLAPPDGVQWSVLGLAGAEALARFPDGDPALTAHAHGAGRAYHLALPFERLLDAPGELARRPWHALYRELAREAGVRPPLRCDSPDVELALLEGEGRRVCVAVNHASEPVAAALAGDALPGGSATVDLPAKGVAEIALEREPAEALA